MSCLLGAGYPAAAACAAFLFRRQPFLDSAVAHVAEKWTPEYLATNEGARNFFQVIGSDKEKGIYGNMSEWGTRGLAGYRPTILGEKKAAAKRSRGAW